MTILPTGPATASSPLAPDTGTGPGDFMAAIEQALAAALGMPAMAPVAPATNAPGFEAPAGAVAPQPPVVATPVAAPGFETVAAQPPQPAVVGSAVTKPTPMPTPMPTPVVELAETPATSALKPAPVVEPVETKATAPGFEAPARAIAPQPPVVAIAAAPTPVVELAETPATSAPKPAPVVEPVETKAAAPAFEAPASAVAPQPAVVTKATTHEQADSGPNDQPAQQAPAPSTLPLTSAVPLPAPATTATAAAPTHAPATAVREQVFGEVTSLVSRGPGTHRITLTLHPETLGEVRVVMTVRDGAVHVRLAAGAEAHQALLDGSSELGHLLERAGATESRVVVREFTPATPASSADSGQLNLSTGDRPTDQHAGTRADHPATDGTDRLLTRHPPVPQEARPTKPVREARTSGLDLTM